MEAEPEQFVTVSGGIALATEAGSKATAPVASPTTRLVAAIRSASRPGRWAHGRPPVSDRRHNLRSLVVGAIIDIEEPMNGADGDWDALGGSLAPVLDRADQWRLGLVFGDPEHRRIHVGHAECVQTSGARSDGARSVSTWPRVCESDSGDRSVNSTVADGATPSPPTRLR